MERSSQFRLEEIKEEINIKSMMIPLFLIEKESVNLPFILDPEENIIGAVASEREKNNGLLLATNSRLIFTDTEAFKSFDNGIPYYKIVQLMCFPHGDAHHSITIVTTERNIKFQTNGMLYAQDFCKKVTGYMTQWKTENSYEADEQDVFKQLEKLGDLW